MPYTKEQLKAFKKDAVKKADEALLKGDLNTAELQAWRSRVIDSELRKRS